MPKHSGAGLREIRTLFTLGTVGSLTDGELLGLFVARRNESAEIAFAALVERHGPMVFRVCRSILHDEHDANDAFQATFLVLFDRAGSIRDRLSVASWLHGVALRVASCARGAVVRRRARERHAANLAAVSATVDRVEPDLAPAVHEELTRLPERYRMPIMLCYLEGLACEEAARLLKLPVGTVKSRLARGRDRLRTRLIRRGFVPSVVLLESLLAGDAASAAIPAAVMQSTVRLATYLTCANPMPGALTVAVRLLTEGALKTMNWDRKRAIVQVGLAAVAVTACVGGAAQFASPSPQAQARAQAHAAGAKEAREPEAESPERLLLRCRDVIEKMPSGFEKSRLFSELGTTQAELSFHKAARESGLRAVEIILATKDEREELPQMYAQERTNELREAAKALAAAGDVDAALAAEAKIGTDTPFARGLREFVLQEVGAALVKTGFFREAKRVMVLMRQRGLKSEIVAFFLVSAQAKAGDIDAAVETADAIADDLFHVAALVGASFDTSTYDAEPEGGIVLAQFESGDRAGAELTVRKAVMIAEKTVDAKSKGQSLSLIARAKLKMGDLPDAIRVAAEIKDEEGRDRALVDIAAAHAKAGEWDEAMKAADSIRGSAARLMGLCRVGRARAKAKNIDAARSLFARAAEIAEDLKSNGQLDPTGAGSVALAQAETGDYRAARETLRRHSSYSAEGGATVIALTQARAGEFASALLSLALLPQMDMLTRSQVLQEIVRLQIESGGDRHLLAAVDGFDSPVCEARVLMGLARGLATRKARSR
jgi:RNA polymerase sigma factor (sigma-70 family)